VIGRERRIGAYLSAATGTDPDTGKPTLTWTFDQAAIDAEAAGDGWYALLSTLGPDQADAAEILRLYKGQEAVSGSSPVPASRLRSSLSPPPCRSISSISWTWTREISAANQPRAENRASGT
jgi:hypothetical protein